jgi:hypothetical protein
MNFKRGLFRLWIVLSLLWLALCALFSGGLPRLENVPLILTPPLILLALGWAAVWAFSGFKHG